MLSGMLALALLAPDAQEHVILLHGLCRSTKSMRRLEESLISCGYFPHNISYPSRHFTIAELSDRYVAKAVAKCNEARAKKIHFVGHSMGAILVREYLSRHSLPNLGRVVMLAPPNQGSEVVDHLRDLGLYRWINGPAGQELGTDVASIANRLPQIDYPVGILAGDRTINWINSLTMIPGRDDGKVSVERTKLPGMADHAVVHTSHPFIMKNRESIEQVLIFLKTGKFRMSTQ
jgi:triacylglycerol lipase